MIAAKLIRAVPWQFRDRIRRLPLISPLQRWFIARTLDGQEFEHVVDGGPARGVRFLIRMPEDKGIWTGAYERDFAAAVAAEMQARRGAVAYDIGGWHGFFTGVLAANGASEVHVFEPLLTNQLRIRRLIELNPEHRVRLHPIAVGEFDGETQLVVMPQTSMAKLGGSAFQSDIVATEHLTVPIRRLDSLVADGSASPPGVVKMDIEGAEFAGLVGARELFARHRPALFMEIHSSELMQSCSDLLTSLGYRIESLDPDPAAARKRDVYQIAAR